MLVIRRLIKVPVVPDIGKKSVINILNARIYVLFVSNKYLICHPV